MAFTHAFGQVPRCVQEVTRHLNQEQSIEHRPSVRCNCPLTHRASDTFVKQSSRQRSEGIHACVWASTSLCARSHSTLEPGTTIEHRPSVRCNCPLTHRASDTFVKQSSRQRSDGIHACVWASTSLCARSHSTLEPGTTIEHRPSVRCNCTLTHRASDTFVKQSSRQRSDGIHTCAWAMHEHRLPERCCPHARSIVIKHGFVGGRERTPPLGPV